MIARQKAAAAQASPDADGIARQVLGAEITLDFESAEADAEPGDVALDPGTPDPAPEGPPENLGGGGAIPRWTRPPLAAIRPPSEARNPSLPTFVGLFMLILTFFVVLTSISINDRKKSEAAMASLQDAFSGNVVRMERTSEADADTAARDFIQGLTGQVQSLIPLMGGKKATPAEHQILWLPISLAFAGKATELDANFAPVLRELLNASAKIPARFEYEVELRLCAAAPSDALRRRAAALADALARLQAPMERFVIGTQACRADRIGFAVALAPIGPAPPGSGSPGSAPPEPAVNP